MYTIAGVTGRVGSVVASRLLAGGERVRVLVRDAAKGRPLERAGADVTVVDLRDRPRLTAALEGSHGFFALLPFDLSAADFHVETDLTIASITGAVVDSGVSQVVALSSWGAELPAGTGPIVGLHRFEQQLRATDAVVSVLRSCHFQEKVGDVLATAQQTGIYPVFGESADTPKPMIATRDIGKLAAEALLSRPRTSEVIDLAGPAYSGRQVADKLAAILGRPLRVVTIPEPGWADALVETGLPRHIAEVLTGLYDADERGLLLPRGDRTVRCTTGIDATLVALLEATDQMATADRPPHAPDLSRRHHARG